MIFCRNICVEIDSLFSRRNYAACSSVLNNLPIETRYSLAVMLLQIHGLACVHGVFLEPTIKARRGRQGNIRYPEITAKIRGKNIRIVTCIQQSPFWVNKENNLVLGTSTIDIDIDVHRVPIADRNNGVYFPQRFGDLDKRYVRFNPKSLGKCSGGCKFCQRAYQMPTSTEAENRFFLAPLSCVTLLKDIATPSEISLLQHALVVTELYNDPESYLNFCWDLKNLLEKEGFNGQFSTLAQEIRTDDHISFYHDIVDGYDFCYTLECFENRSDLMSPIKGLDMLTVNKILHKVQKYNFYVVFINYMAGLDSASTMTNKLSEMRQKNLISAVGLNIFTPYTDLQFEMKNAEANFLSYYYDLASAFEKNALAVYAPEFYERFPAIFWASKVDSISPIYQGAAL